MLGSSIVLFDYALFSLPNFHSCKASLQACFVLESDMWHHFPCLIGPDVSIKKSLLEASVGKRYCLIGTLFKKMELKPNILKEISANVNEFSGHYWAT